MTLRIKPLTFLLLPLFACLLSGCSTLYHDYLFAEKDIKSLTKSVSPGVMNRFYTNFRIEFDTWYNEEEKIHAGRYEFFIGIYPERNLMENVYINNITIYAGDNRYIMNDKVSHIITVHQASPLTFVARTKGDDLLNINSSGIINIADTYNDLDDRYTLTGRVEEMHIFFQEISVDVKKYKELKVAIDLSVEYANGQTVTLNREFVASLKKKRVPEVTFGSVIWFLFGWFLPTA